jgi:hypothetical protein
VAFALRTAAEQAGLVSVFGRWLNSLDAPVQVLVQARPVDLSGLVDHLAAEAPQLADPALEQAALQHAAFLSELNDSRDLLTRQVLIVIRDDAYDQRDGGSPLWGRSRRRTTVREASACVVLRRAEEAVRSLSVLGISTEVLDAAACTAVLAESLSPGEARLVGVSAPDDLITVQEALR